MQLISGCIIIINYFNVVLNRFCMVCYSSLKCSRTNKGIFFMQISWDSQLRTQLFKLGKLGNNNKKNHCSDFILFYFCVN